LKYLVKRFSWREKYSLIIEEIKALKVQPCRISLLEHMPLYLHLI